MLHIVRRKKNIVWLAILSLMLLFGCDKQTKFHVGTEYQSKVIYNTIGNCIYDIYTMKDSFYYIEPAENNLYYIHSYEIDKGENGMVEVYLSENETIHSFAVSEKKEYWFLLYKRQNSEYVYCLNHYSAKGVLEETVVLSEFQDSEGILRVFFDAEGNICIQTTLGIVQYSDKGKYLQRKNIEFSTNYYIEIAKSQYLVLDSGTLTYYRQKEAELVLNCLTHNILPMDIWGFHIFGEEGGLYFVTQQTTDAGYKLSVYIFNPKVENDVHNRQKITIATYGLMGARAEETIAEYNVQSKEYYVEIIDYSIGEASTDEATIKLGADIAAGNGPDIIDDGLFDINVLIEKGYLEDLIPYIERDETINLSHYMENIINTYMQEGHLYQLPTVFRVTSAYGSATLLYNYDSFTLKSLYEVMDNNPQIQTIMGLPQEDTLFFLCLYNKELFVNEENNNCYFDSEEFKELLIFIKEREKSADLFAEYQRIGISEDPYTRVQNQKQLLAQEGFFGHMMYQAANQIIQDMVVVGYPCIDGDGTYAASIGLSFSMTIDSKNKEGVWDFVRFALSEEQQDKHIESSESLMGISYPIRKSSFLKYIEEISTPLYTENVDGTLCEQELTSINGCPIYAMSDIEKEQFIEIIMSISKNNDEDKEMFDIILEESGYYFEDQKTVDEVAKTIQNRVQVLLYERE